MTEPGFIPTPGSGPADPMMNLAVIILAVVILVVDVSLAWNVFLGKLDGAGFFGSGFFLMFWAWGDLVILVGWGVILPVAGVFVDGIVFWLVFLFLLSGGDGVFLEASVCVQAGCLTCLLLVQSSPPPSCISVS